MGLHTSDGRAHAAGDGQTEILRSHWNDEQSLTLASRMVRQAGSQACACSSSSLTPPDTSLAAEAVLGPQTPAAMQPASWPTSVEQPHGPGQHAVLEWNGISPVGK